MDDTDDIGSKLIASFREIFNEQVLKALARRIHAKVRDARGDPDRAARRWPFELIQNAHDAGQRDDRDGISVDFEYVDGVLRFKHDAAPFTMSDIASLLTGGSSKDFDSHETTGRFGTGFLVTHVLSQRVIVTGILEADGEHRVFDVTLDRPDDEDLILRSIEDSETALRKTRALTDISVEPTATVSYVVEDDEIAHVGLSMLEQTLPHLFGACQRLRRVRIRRGDLESCWQAVASTAALDRDGVWTDEVEVRSVDGNGEETRWRVVRATTDETARGWLLLVLRKDGDAWVVCKPGDMPSVFRQLPLFGGPALSAWVIIDGEFDVDQERSSIHVVGDRGGPLREAFAALGGLALLATREGWINGYRVAQLAMPTTESLGEAAAKVWREVLSSAAAKSARLPLVKTLRSGMLPAVQTDEHDRYVDFVSRTSPGPSHAELWELAAQCTEVDPPTKSESEGWSEIAEAWEALGVPIPWIDLKAIGQRACSETDKIAELAVDGEPYHWLAQYLDAVGNTWHATGITKSHVAGLLPDQHGKLHNSGELRREGGVTDRVKAIAADVGMDIKAQLLDELLIQALTEQGLEAGVTAIHESTRDELGEDEALRSLVQHIAEALPADRPVGEEERTSAAASIALFEHLWESLGAAARNTAWEVPLLAADGTARRAGHRRLMVPPVPMWPEAAQAFAQAYPPSRVLANDYVNAAQCDTLLKAMATWGVAHLGLIEMGHREELGDRGLRAIAVDAEQVAGARLRDVKLMQIALLEPEVINYCKQSRDRARALLGLVVCYIAPVDESWRSTVEMSVRTPDGEKQIQLTPSLWLADLRSKPWIPVESEEDVTHHVPNPKLLSELIAPAWLEGNRDGANLLVRHFDMDALDVRLLAAAKDEEARQRLRDCLARIVEVAGDNPQMIEDLVVKAEQRRRDVERMRNLGLAVQESVKAALERCGLDVQDVDRGYDFLVTAVRVREEDPEDLSAYFEVGRYKVEVKTTTTGEARLTPLQAATTVDDPESFTLCVVDLRNFEGDVHRVNWSTTDVSGRCRLISGRDVPIDETLTLVRDAEGRSVPIRNASALRYAVGPDLWESGVDLNQWVRDSFAPPPAPL